MLRSMLLTIIISVLVGCDMSDEEAPVIIEKQFMQQMQAVLTDGYFYGWSEGLPHDTEFQFYFHPGVELNNKVTITAKGEAPWTTIWSSSVFQGENLTETLNYAPTVWYLASVEVRFYESSNPLAGARVSVI